jgi:hypothetical protein
MWRVEMKIRQLFAGIRYVGRAEGDRRSYYVFQSDAGYLVLTPNSEYSFTANIVDAGAPEVVTRKFKGKELTAKDLREMRRRDDLFGRPFAALNALYAMVALRYARKLKRREGKAMVFKIH